MLRVCEERQLEVDRRLRGACGVPRRPSGRTHRPEDRESRDGTGGNESHPPLLELLDPDAYTIDGPCGREFHGTRGTRLPVGG